ncbi:coproporphyrinogen III oxidase [Athelia psychrophila]|uniref:coproporphyrinogen oxidase n=1 Tax=Athelia psychrophila TaxID=1759441 RepID=A0A167UT99_9AGAM|nr:coproporphyrinogen III oxidase [Fibularhizoctonia sp. CBS 109695]
MSAASTKPMRQQVEEYIIKLQDEIVNAFEKLDPNASKFKRDSWVRPQGGSGQSCVFAAPPSSSATTNTHAPILEKAGVNISIVHGNLPPAAIKQMRADHSTLPYDPESKASLPFFAAGLSLVVHAQNPSAPTVHANYRYFEITEPIAEGEEGTGKVLAWWFGGGSDLTPSYFFEEDARHFHGTIKSACDCHGKELYPIFKKWCDEYFFIPHRGESRGIGGIFFDDLSDGEHAKLSTDVTRPRTPDEIFQFVQSLGNAFIPSYLPVLERRISTPSDEHKRRWQLLRRGRYVEFNLVYDRGTKFGLMTPGARIESILMSLPETARWEYMSEMGNEADGSEEGKLVEILKNPREWA